MSEQTRRNAKIAGAGDLAGGTYGDVTVAGAAKILDDIDVTRLKVAGSANVLGNVVAESVNVSGGATFGADVQAAEVTVSGGAEFAGGIGARKLKVAGTCTIGGAVNAIDVEVRGTVKIGGDVQAETFDSQGVFSIGGLLNAGSVKVKLYGGCDAHDIGGETIDISSGKTWAFLPFLGDRNLTADTIEGDVVTLENTRAKVVRGRDVRIGAGCDIDLVEYTGTFEGAAGVKSSRRIEKAS